MKLAGRYDVARLGVCLGFAMSVVGNACAQTRITNASASANAAQIDFNGGPTFTFNGLSGTVGATLAPPHVNIEARASLGTSSNGASRSYQETAGATLIWWEPEWRLGASLGHQHTDRPGSDVNVTNLHGYGVWFPSESVTLSAKAGGFSGTRDGKYAGVAINWYLTEDLALFGAFDGTSFDANFQESDWTASVQWLPTRQLPVSLALGVTHSQISGRFDARATAAFVGVRLFFNRSGETSLRGRERTGPTGWPSTFGPQGLGF